MTAHEKVRAALYNPSDPTNQALANLFAAGCLLTALGYEAAGSKACESAFRAIGRRLPRSVENAIWTEPLEIGAEVAAHSELLEAMKDAREPAEEVRARVAALYPRGPRPPEAESLRRAPPRGP